MDCPGFESVLGRALLGELPEAERRAALDELLRHAHGCPSCDGTTELLDWLALPDDDRDIVSAPGPGYWDEFNRRVRERLDEPATAARRRAWLPATVAAGLVVAVAGAWLALAPVRAPGSRPEPLGSELPSPSDPRETLARRIAEDPGALSSLGLAGDDGWAGSPEHGGWMYPDTTDLDPTARRELLEWLRQDAAGTPELES